MFLFKPKGTRLNIPFMEKCMDEKKHCKWCNDEFCTNDKSPCVADYCPCVEYPELCKFREVEEKNYSVLGKTKDEIASYIRGLREIVEDSNVGIKDKELQIAKFMGIIEQLLEADL